MTLLLAACGKLGPGWEGRGEVKEGTCQGWRLNSGLDAYWLCALVSWEMGMRKLVFQNLDVGDEPELRHHLMLYPRVLLRLFRTQPFLPSPPHDVQTSAVATSLLLSCPTQSGPLGAAGRSPEHPVEPPPLRTFPGTHLTQSQSQVLSGFCGPGTPPTP